MSNLLVQNIKHTNNTTAQTIDTSGRTTVSIMNNDSTFRSDGGAVTKNLVQGLCKAWIDFNGTGTAAIRGSFNFSGHTDHGTGIYTQTFTSGFSNVNYGVGSTQQDDEENSDNGSGTISTIHRASTARSTASLKMGSNIAGSATRADSIISYVVHGDLA